MVFRLSVELGGHHAVQDDRNTAARRNGIRRLRSRANHGSSSGSDSNSDRRTGYDPSSIAMWSWVKDRVAGSRPAEGS